MEASSNVLPFVPYCGEPVAPAEFWFAWNLDPKLLLAFALAAGLGHRYLRTAPAANRAYFAAGWLLLFIALVSPLCNLTSALFSARVGQHLIVMQLAAPLIVLSGVLNRWHGLMRWRPGLAWAVHGALIWLWHLPAPYELALRHEPVLWAMHLSLFVSALPAWRAVLRPADTQEQGRAMLALFTTAVHMGMLAAVLTLAPRPLFDYHVLTAGQWGLTGLEDQQLAGLIMWLPGCALYFAAALWLITRVLASLEREREPA